MTLKLSQTLSTVKVSLSMEPTKPVAFNSFDTGERHILDIHAAYDDEWPRSSGTYRGIMSGDVLRDYPRQAVSPTEAGNAPADTLVSQRKTDDAFSSGRKRSSSKDSKKHLVRTKPKTGGTVRKQRRKSRLDPYPCFSRHAKETYSVDRRNFFANGPHESHITHSATLSASTSPDGRLTDLVSKDTMITERQFDFAKFCFSQVGIINDQ